MDFQLLLASALIALALGEDLREGRIPNGLLLRAFLLGLISFGPEPGAPSVIAGKMLFPILPAFLFLLIFFLAGALGAGDVKLLALLAGLLPHDFYRLMLGLALGQGAILGAWSLRRRMKTGRWMGRPGEGGKKIHFTICIGSSFFLLACIRALSGI